MSSRIDGFGWRRGLVTDSITFFDSSANLETAHFFINYKRNDDNKESVFYIVALGTDKIIKMTRKIGSTSTLKVKTLGYTVYVGMLDKVRSNLENLFESIKECSYSITTNEYEITTGITIFC